MAPRHPVLPDAPHLVVVVGERVGERVGDAARTVRRDGDRLRWLPDPDDADRLLDDELARLTTGWRLAVVGTERDARVVRAAALARGALDEEITVVPVGDADPLRRVFCGTCHHRFDTPAAVGAVVACPACHGGLTVSGHVSARHGAVLGGPR